MLLPPQHLQTQPTQAFSTHSLWLSYVLQPCHHLLWVTLVWNSSFCKQEHKTFHMWCHLKGKHFHVALKYFSRAACVEVHFHMHQLAQLGKRLFRYLASLISLNVLLLSLSLKILVSLSLWQLQEICATYSTLIMHSLRPFAFLTRVWPPTPLGDTLCPHLLPDQKNQIPLQKWVKQRDSSLHQGKATHWAIWHLLLL